MTFEEFEKAKPEELRHHAKGCFDRCFTDYMTGDFRTATLLEAQFYMAEMDRRESDRVSNRDYRLELWVIALIGLEILLGIAGISISIWDGSEQAQILSKLNASASATADTMTTLQATTKTMNEASSNSSGLRKRCRSISPAKSLLS